MGKLESLIGGARRDRTADLLTASQTLSQLSYSPKTLAQMLTKVPKVINLSLDGVSKIVVLNFAYGIYKFW